MVSKHWNEGQCQFIPDYTPESASGLAVETQLSWLFLWLFLIIPLIILFIPNYSYYAHIRSRSYCHSLGNQLPQERAIACRGPEDHCPLWFHFGQQPPGRRWKESVVFCCLCLSALQLGIIRIIQIIKIIVIIGISKIISIIEIIEIISKISPEHQALKAELAGARCVTDELLSSFSCMNQGGNSVSFGTLWLLNISTTQQRHAR